jgi:hypothetical protein
LLLGIGQVANLVTTFGSSFSSGLLLFGGGDSQGIGDLSKQVATAGRKNPAPLN